MPGAYPLAISLKNNGHVLYHGLSLILMGYHILANMLLS